MNARLHWAPSFRVIASKYPTVSVYDRLAGTRDFSAVIEIEALTNPRVREEIGDYRKVRPEDLVSGPGTTPVMASFAYTGASRFSDGTYGVYYCSRDEATAVAESIYHTELFMRATNEPSTDLDKRLYTADITGTYDDLRARSARSNVYDKVSYVHSQAYAARIYQENVTDGIVYNSVRRSGGECAAVFRPRLVTNYKLLKYLQFRWQGGKIIASADLALRSA